MRSKRLAIAGVMSAAAVIAAAWPAARAQPASPSSAAAGPIAYYVARCARCHGDVTNAYVGVDRPKRGRELEQIIDDMATGPAQDPLDAEGLKQQTALHEAMFGKTPFVWLDSARPARIAGEVLPGTTLTFEPKTGPTTRPAVKDSRYDFDRTPGTLVGRRGEKVMKVDVR